MIKVKNLQDFDNLADWYSEIRKQQCKAHGEDYCNQHDAVKKVLPPGGIYKEFGVAQGASAANACLLDTKKITIVDPELKWFKPHEPVFRKWCDQYSKEFNVLNCSSLSSSAVSECDVLLIDSLHKIDHLKQELVMHQETVNSHIVIHDTTHKPQLWIGVLWFLGKYTNWKLEERDEKSVGYTLLRKK